MTPEERVREFISGAPIDFGVAMLGFRDRFEAAMVKMVREAVDEETARIVLQNPASRPFTEELCRLFDDIFDDDVAHVHSPSEVRRGMVTVERRVREKCMEEMQFAEKQLPGSPTYAQAICAFFNAIKSNMP